MGVWEDLLGLAPVATVGLNIWDYYQAALTQQERAGERQQGFETIDQLQNRVAGGIPQLSFEGQQFGAGVGDPSGGFGKSAATTTFQPGFGPGNFTGPDIFNIQSTSDIEQEQLGNLGLAGVSPEDRFGTLSDSLLDPFAFDDQESGIRADSQAGFDRGDSSRQQGLDSINQTADRDVDSLRANLRGDFQGVEGLELPKADEIFRRTQEQGTRDALSRERSALQSGQQRTEDLGRLGFDAFDSSIFGVQQSALDQRLADIQNVNFGAEQARTGTLGDNAEKRLGLFGENQATNRGLFDSIGDIFNTRNQNVGVLEDNFLGLDADRTSDLNASLDSLNERRTTTQQGISSFAAQFLSGLPQNVLAQQSGQLGNMGQGLQSIISSFGPDFELAMMRLGLIGDREDIMPQAGAIGDALLGFGTGQEYADQPQFIYAGGA